MRRYRAVVPGEYSQSRTLQRIRARQQRFMEVVNIFHGVPTHRSWPSPAGSASDCIRSPAPAAAAKRSAGFLVEAYEPRQKGRIARPSSGCALNQTTSGVPDTITIICIIYSDRMIFSAFPIPIIECRPPHRNQIRRKITPFPIRNRICAHSLSRAAGRGQLGGVRARRPHRTCDPA